MFIVKSALGFVQEKVSVLWEYVPAMRANATPEDAEGRFKRDEVHG